MFITFVYVFSMLLYAQSPQVPLSLSGFTFVSVGLYLYMYCYNTP